jgi:hypothetical protein
MYLNRSRLCAELYCSFQVEDERCGKAVLEREFKQVQARVASLQACSQDRSDTQTSDKCKCELLIKIMLILYFGQTWDSLKELDSFQCS